MSCEGGVVPRILSSQRSGLRSRAPCPILEQQKSAREIQPGSQLVPRDSAPLRIWGDGTLSWGSTGLEYGVSRGDIQSLGWSTKRSGNCGVFGFVELVQNDDSQLSAVAFPTASPDTTEKKVVLRALLSA